MKLVLLHPLPLDSSMWPTEVMGLVTDCIAPDLYPLGSDIRGWARAVLDLAGDGPIIVVGNSVGGSCAIEVALLAPDKVRALVLSGTKAGHNPDPQLRDEVLRVLGDEGIHAAWARYWRPLFGPDTDATVLERAKRAAVRQGEHAVANGVRAFHSRPSRDDFLDRWSGPVWVVSGNYDIAPLKARASAQRLPGGRYREVRGAGHYVPIEAPSQFARIVAEALHAS